MSKTFTKPFARSDFPLHSTSKESGRAALVTAVALNNLDVPDFLVLIYPRGGGDARGDRVCRGGRHSSPSSHREMDPMRQQQDQGHLPCSPLPTADVAVITQPMQFPTANPRYGPLGGPICHCHYLSDQQNIHLGVGPHPVLCPGV